MRMGISKDIRIGSMLTEYIQYFIDTTTFLASSIEFAIAIGSSTALTKTVVALTIHLLCLGDVAEVFLALTHILASLQHDRAITQLYQSQGGKETAGSLSHHNDTWATAHIGIFGVNILVVLRKLIDVSTHLQIDEDGTLACIDASLQHTHLVQSSDIQAFLLGEITLDAFLTSCLFGQNPDLVFLNHILCILNLYLSQHLMSIKVIHRHLAIF